MAAEFNKTPAERERHGDPPNVAAPVAVIDQDIPSELPILPMRNIPVFPA